MTDHDKRWTGKIDLNQPVPDPFGDGKTHEWIESHDLSEWRDKGFLVFWDDLRRDLADPEYAKYHRRSLRRLKWRAFWWGFTHPFADPRQSRPLTKFEEWRYSKKVRHEASVDRGWSCNRMFRGFCWRCVLRDLSGATRRRHRERIAQMRSRQAMTPPLATRTWEGLDAKPTITGEHPDLDAIRAAFPDEDTAAYDA